MSELKKIREQQNLTQEELAEKSGISARTIQRIEAGTEPKGYTLKTLAATLGISEKDLLIPEIIIEEDVIEEEIISAENKEASNFTLTKIINISSLPFSWLPIANFLPPILIMLFTKERNPIVKQIISLQIFLAVICPIIFMTVVFFKLGKASVLVTMIVLTLINVFIILRNAYEIDNKKCLYFKLNFNLL
ncbi:DNA-binding protein [Chryseobacterium sp. CBo1]|uniref:helix-turn-helix domain-containing protein n=1 Tax=Chryseobacterium sp. CBo1 TaxID=1869230 RepID=UPI0008109162|nr:helix-turn-helix domain-containing protein [Chryseobacterium sp. CBo1]OCK53302.1 DNA-binding protein [Chryseobacterium sp. CBo1]